MGAINRAPVLILANEACLARRGLSAESLVELMAGVGLRAEVLLLPQQPSELARLADQLSADPPRVAIAAGGDGTVHQVVNLVASRRVPLGVLPLGTANDFARGLQLPTDLQEAARLIAEEVPLAVDVGIVHGGADPGGQGERFVNAAHLGLGVETAKRTDPQLKRWLGPLAYGMAALQAWRETEPLSIELCGDDRCTRMRASQLLVGAGMFFGGGNRLGKPAMDAGLLEVFALTPDLGAARALEVVAALRMGTLADHGDTLHFRTARLEVRLSRPAEVNLDGELIDCGRKLTFELLPGGLSVYARSTGAEGALDPMARQEGAWT